MDANVDVEILQHVLEVCGDEKEVDATESELGYHEEDVDDVPGTRVLVEADLHRV